MAIAFNRGIGMDRKIARLRFLRDRWANRLLSASDRVHMITPIGPNTSGAIGVFGVDGLDMGKLGGWLLSKHNIVTTPMVTDEFQGMRITPERLHDPRRGRSVRRPRHSGDSNGHRASAPEAAIARSWRIEDL